MTSYLQISPTVAFTVLSEILASSGITVDEPDSARIAQVLTPKGPAKEPMVSIPVVSASADVKEVYRATRVGDEDEVPNVLSFNELGSRMTMCRFNEIELELLLLQRTIPSGQDEDDRDLSFLTKSLSLSLMEAQFLRMHLKEFNLKARSVLELFKYCEGPNDRFCRCPEIRKRVYEMGILVQRSAP